MKRADESGALYTVIIGDEEVESGKATVKAMRQGAIDGEQTQVVFNELADYVLEQVVQAEALDGVCDF